MPVKMGRKIAPFSFFMPKSAEVNLTKERDTISRIVQAIEKEPGIRRYDLLKAFGSQAIERYYIVALRRANRGYGQ